MTRKLLAYHLGLDNYHFYSFPESNLPEDDVSSTFNAVLGVENFLEGIFYKPNVVSIINIDYFKDEEDTLKKREKLKHDNYNAVGNLTFPLGFGRGYNVEKINDLIAVAEDRIIVDYKDILAINHPVMKVLEEFNSKKKENLENFRKCHSVKGLLSFKNEKYFSSNVIDQYIVPKLTAIIGHVHKNNQTIMLNGENESFSEYEFELKESKSGSDKWSDALGSLLRVIREKQNNFANDLSCDTRIGITIMKPMENFYSCYYEISHKKEGHYNRLCFVSNFEINEDGIKASKFNLINLMNLFYYMRIFEKKVDEQSYEQDSFITDIMTNLKSAYSS